MEFQSNMAFHLKYLLYHVLMMTILLLAFVSATTWNVYRVDASNPDEITVRLNNGSCETQISNSVRVSKGRTCRCTAQKHNFYIQNGASTASCYDDEELCKVSTKDLPVTHEGCKNLTALTLVRNGLYIPIIECNKKDLQYTAYFWNSEAKWKNFTFNVTDDMSYGQHLVYFQNKLLQDLTGTLIRFFFTCKNENGEKTPSSSILLKTKGNQNINIIKSKATPTVTPPASRTATTTPTTTPLSTTTNNTMPPTTTTIRAPASPIIGTAKTTPTTTAPSTTTSNTMSPTTTTSTIRAPTTPATRITTTTPTTTAPSTTTSNTMTPTSTTTKIFNGDKEGEEGKGLKIQMVLAVAIPIALLFIVIILAIILWFWCKRNSKRSCPESRRAQVHYDIVRSPPVIVESNAYSIIQPTVHLKTFDGSENVNNGADDIPEYRVLYSFEDTKEVTKEDKLSPYEMETNDYEIIQRDNSQINENGVEKPVYAKVSKDLVSTYDVLDHGIGTIQINEREKATIGFGETQTKGDYDVITHEIKSNDDDSIVHGNAGDKFSMQHDNVSEEIYSKPHDNSTSYEETSMVECHESEYDVAFHEERIVSDVYATVNKNNENT